MISPELKPSMGGTDVPAAADLSHRAAMLSGVSNTNGGLAVNNRADPGWRCQICGNPITDTGAGQVLFSDDPQSPDDFLIFHTGTCDPHADGPDDLLCTDTLADVLARARNGEFGWAGSTFSGRSRR